MIVFLPEASIGGILEKISMYHRDFDDNLKKKSCEKRNSIIWMKLEISAAKLSPTFTNY